MELMILLGFIACFSGSASSQWSDSNNHPLEPAYQDYIYNYNPCELQPCQNGGTCFKLIISRDDGTTRVSYRCSCGEYYGDRCQYECSKQKQAGVGMGVIAGFVVGIIIGIMAVSGIVCLAAFSNVTARIARRFQKKKKADVNTVESIRTLEDDATCWSRTSAYISDILFCMCGCHTGQHKQPSHEYSDVQYKLLQET